MAYGNGEQWGGPVQQAGSLGQTFTSVNKDPERPQVGRELDQHQKAAEALHTTIDQLLQRLEPILTPTPPRVGEGAGATPAQMSSSVVSILRANGYRIDAATQRLVELIGRIEL